MDDRLTINGHTYRVLPTLRADYKGGYKMVTNVGLQLHYAIPNFFHDMSIFGQRWFAECDPCCFTKWMHNWIDQINKDYANGIFNEWACSQKVDFAAVRLAKSNMEGLNNYPSLLRRALFLLRAAEKRHNCKMHLEVGEDG